MFRRLNVAAHHLLFALTLLVLHSGCRSFDEGGWNHDPRLRDGPWMHSPPPGDGLEPAYLVFPKRSPQPPGKDLPPGAPLVFIVRGWIYGNVLEGKATPMDQLIGYGFPPPKLPDVSLPLIEDSGVIDITLRRDQIGSANHIELQGADDSADIGDHSEYVLRIGNFNSGPLRWTIHVKTSTGVGPELFGQTIGAPPSTSTSGSSAVLSSTGTFNYSLAVVHAGKILTFHLWQQ